MDWQPSVERPKQDLSGTIFRPGLTPELVLKWVLMQREWKWESLKFVLVLIAKRVGFLILQEHTGLERRTMRVVFPKENNKRCNFYYRDRASWSNSCHGVCSHEIAWGPSWTWIRDTAQEKSQQTRGWPEPLLASHKWLDVSSSQIKNDSVPPSNYAQTERDKIFTPPRQTAQLTALLLVSDSPAADWWLGNNTFHTNIYCQADCCTHGHSRSVYGFA